MRAGRGAIERRPSGVPGLIYQITAVRSTTRGGPAQFNGGWAGGTLTAGGW